MTDHKVKKIAILGATGHIAKGLIYGLSRDGKYDLCLFARSPELVKIFLEDIAYCGRSLISGLDGFNAGKYDAVINCIGISGSRDINNRMDSVFGLTEKYDNLVLEHIEREPDTLYINLSSGAVYGCDFSDPITVNSYSKWNVNNISDSDFYGVAKFYSETKHRAKKSLNIVDLRVFSYFSRFIDLESSFLVTEIISCIKSGKEFITGQDNIMRDYVHPADLAGLVESCILRQKVNDAFEVYSQRPVSKIEILNYFRSVYGLKYKIMDDIKVSAITGSKDNYFSTSKKAETLGYKSKYTSMDCIVEETKFIMDQWGR